MQAEREIILTASGLKKIEEELDKLRTVYRKRVAERMREALETGGEMDDNTEVEDVRAEQAVIESRISQLRQILGVARVLEETDVNSDLVGVGAIVKVKDLESADECEWTIVGAYEANPAEDRISNESPVGKALMNLKVGDIAEVEIPAGIVKYEILNIRR